MTYLEMKRELISRIDTMTSNTAPGYSDYSYSLWLTEAQEELVSELLGEKVTPTSKIVKRFDEDDITRLGLYSLIIRADMKISSYSADYLYGYNFKHTNLQIKMIDIDIEYSGIPYHVRHILGEQCTIEDINRRSQEYQRNIKVKGISHNYFLSNIDNPFKQPNKNLMWRLIKNVGRESALSYEIVHSKDVVPIRYILVVLKNPLPIIVGNLGSRTIDGRSIPANSEIDVKYHRTIIDKAVRIAQGVIKDPQAYQIANVEENK